jgi:hypothetical protein
VASHDRSLAPGLPILGPVHTGGGPLGGAGQILLHEPRLVSQKIPKPVSKNQKQKISNEVLKQFFPACDGEDLASGTLIDCVPGSAATSFLSPRGTGFSAGVRGFLRVFREYGAVGLYPPIDRNVCAGLAWLFLEWMKRRPF